MPTSFALELSEQLCQFFSVQATAADRSEFAKAIDFHAKFLNETDKQHLGPLLLIECADKIEERRENNSEFELRMGDLHTLLSRVQKRIYREARHRDRSSDAVIQLQPAKAQVDSALVEQVMADFQTYLLMTSSTRDADIFELRFIRRKTIADICNAVNAGKSTVNERIRIIKEAFSKFLEDVAFPGFHET